MVGTAAYPALAPMSLWARRLADSAWLRYRCGREVPTAAGIGGGTRGGGAGWAATITLVAPPARAGAPIPATRAGPMRSHDPVMEPPTTRALAPNSSSQGESALPRASNADANTSAATPVPAPGQAGHLGRALRDDPTAALIVTLDGPGGNDVLQWLTLDPEQVDPSFAGHARPVLADKPPDRNAEPTPVPRVMATQGSCPAAAPKSHSPSRKASASLRNFTRTRRARQPGS